MNIVLIGYRGAGKSAVSKVLARRLNRLVVSTDAEVVKRAGMTIPDLVRQQGWDYFREIESAVCRDLAEKDHLIVDSGGGAILRPENVQNFKKNGRLYWLTVSVATSAKRIGHDTQRPSLTGGKSFLEEIQEVLAERMPKYRAAADETIETEGLTVNQVADSILRSAATPLC